MDVGIPRVTDYELKYEKVERRSVDFEGKPIGNPTENQYWTPYYTKHS